jgi:parvulin-like peptidyl-prolyl isomerase
MGDFRYQLLCGMFCLAAAVGPAVAGEPVGRLLALVEKRAVTQRDVAQRLALGGVEPQGATRERWQKALIEAIDHQVLLVAALRSRTYIAESEVETAMRGLRSGPRAAEYEREIKVLGLSEKAERERLREQLLLERWLAEQLAAKLFVPPGEVRRWYDEHRAELAEPEARVARVLTLRISPQRDEAAAREQMAKLCEQIRDGVPFADAAKTHSEDPWGPRGGLLDPIKRGDSGSIFAAEVFKLRKVGDRSEVFKSELGLHVVELEAIRPGRLPAFEEVQEQILARLRGVLRAKHLARLAEDWRRKMTVRVFWDQLPGKPSTE